MGFERFPRPPRRERTFAELFPWRNIGRALMLLALIAGIVMAKRFMGPLLARTARLWGLPQDAPRVPAAKGSFGVHLGPTLVAPRGAVDTVPPTSPDTR